MDDNLTYMVVRRYLEKKIINYLYKENEITISEYEVMCTNYDLEISKLNKKINNNNIYKNNIEVDICI